MNPVIIAAIVIVTLALLFYTLGVVTEQRKKRVTTAVMAFMTLGVVFDISATACMIIGSKNTAFSLHGILGYSSLAGMVIDTILIYRFGLAHSPHVRVPRGLHLYSRLAYLWWVAAYVTGGLLVAMG